MKKYSITSKYTAAVPRSQRRKNVEGRSVVAGYSAGGGSGVDRSYVDANFVTLATEQVITANKDFAAGISMYGIPWEYDIERDVWTIKGNVIITKGLATYSTLNEDDVLSVFDGLPIDLRTIVWNNGVLEVNQDMIGGLDEDALKDYLDTNKYTTQTWISEQKYATQKWVEDKKFVSEDVLGEKFVTIDTEQTITGLKDFTGGFKINSIPISYNAEKNAIILPTNVVIEGGLATYTKLEGFEDLGIMAAIETDEKTISKVGGVLHFIGETGGLDETQLEDYLTTNGYATQTWVTNNGYALQSSLTAVDNRLKSVETFFATDDTDSYVNKWDEIVTFLNAVEGDTLDDILSTKFDKSDFTYSNIKSTLGIYSWALASSKPSYSYSEISGRPTALSDLEDDILDGHYLPIDGIADRAKILASSLTATSYLLFYSNELNHCNNSGSTNRFWFGYRKPDGSSRSTNQWLFSSSASTALADGEIWAGKIYIGDKIGNFSSDSFQAPLHVNGNAYVGGTFYLNGAPLTYNSSKNAWQLEGNLIVTGGLATYTKLSGFTDLDVMGGVVTDGTTIHINSAGHLEVIGGTGGGGSVSITGAASTIVSSNLTASRALISNSSGKVAVSAVTSTELGYLDGVTSAIQTQLNNKQATLESGTNIKTINGTSILGSGDLAVSADSATNIVLGTVSPSSTTSYYPAMVTGTSSGSKYGIKVFGNPVRYALKAGTTSATGIAELILGNSTNSGASGNSEGALCLYPATSSYYSILKASSSVSGNYTNYLPKSSGTLLNENSLKTINGYSLVGSGDITISGGASGDYLPLDGGEISGTVVFSKSLTASFAGAQIQLGPSQKARLSANNDGSLWLFGSKISFYPNASASSANTNQMVLATSGTLTVSGSVTENSDRKLKNIEYEGDGLDLDVLKKVKVAKWHWKDNKRDKRLHIGGVADNLAEVMPEVVFESQEEDGTTTSSIAYGKAGFSIAASLIAPVARHEDRIKELEKNIEKMQKELNQLRKTA